MKGESSSGILKQEKLEKVLLKCEYIFSKDDCDIGDIKDFKMSINMVDDIPVNAAYRKIPPNLYTEVKNYVEDLRTNGWIRESYSSYSSPIVCVRKIDGQMRLLGVKCQDCTRFSTHPTDTGYP